MINSIGLYVIICIALLYGALAAQERSLEQMEKDDVK